MRRKSIWKLGGVILVTAVIVACVVTVAPLFSQLGTDVAGFYNGITEVWVDDDFTPDTQGWGITHFDNIQEGIEAVTGSTVYVADGVYTPIRPGEHQGHILIDSRSDLELIGSGATTTIIQGDHSTGAVWVVNSTNILIRGFTITDGGSLHTNTGGGIQAIGSTLIVENCIIRDNDAVGGGGVFGEQGSHVTIVNSIIANNRAQNRGGAVVSNGSIVCSTIVNNVGMYDGWGGVGGGDESLIVTNCIVWGNGDDILAASVEPFPPTIVTYSNIEDGDVGEGNISADPLFVDPTSGNYHLQICSPCIDAGTNTGAPTEDIEGNPRPIDGDGDTVAITDMGAYEKEGVSKISIQAYIDGRSQLIITGNTVQWHHLDWAAPGRLEGADEPTIINGVEWYPEWPDVPDAENRQECHSSIYEDLDPALPEIDVVVELDIIQSRNSITIAQQPSAGNDYTLVVEFDDNPQGGAAWYECELTVTCGGFP